MSQAEIYQQPKEPYETPHLEKLLSFQFVTALSVPLKSFSDIPRNAEAE